MKHFTREQALRFHRALPPHIRYRLGEAGISRGLIHTRLIGWDGGRITVPLFDDNRNLTGFDYFEATDSAIVLSKRPGDTSPLVLYGRQALNLQGREVYVCQGVMEQLVLSSQMCPVVAPSGDGLGFRGSWVRELSSVERIVVCFKGDAVSKLAGARIADAVPGSVQVELDDDGVRGFFVNRKRTWMDFERQVEEAKRRAEHGS